MKFFFLSIFFFPLAAYGQITTSLDLTSESTLLTPGSPILGLDGQELVLSALPDAYKYEAELVFSTAESGFDADNFNASCEGRSNTLVVGISEIGNVFGGYNEGVWLTDNQSQTGLDNNFLFSVFNNQIYEAIPNTPHIQNSDISGPAFGASLEPDMRFGGSGSSVILIRNILGGSYQCQSEANCLSLLNNNVGWLNGSTYNEDRFTCTAYEVWQLKTEGLPVSSSIINYDFDSDGIIEATVNCLDKTAPVFPSSQILTDSEDALLASWLPGEFHYESTSLYNTSGSQANVQDFYTAVNNNENTLILVQTQEGEIIGGFNEGNWSQGPAQLNLDENFIFNLTDKRKHQALPGVSHISTGTEIEFGDSDLIFYFQFGEHYSEFTNYSPTSSSFQNTSTYEYLTEEDTFEIDRIEVYKLNNTGEPIFLPVDEDNNGICDHLDINNFISNNLGSCPGDFDANGSITASDLTSFLSVYGSECD